MRLPAESLHDRLIGSLQPVCVQLGALGFFIHLLVLPVSIYSLQVFDRVLATESMSTLFWLTFVMLLLFAAAGLLQSLRTIILQRIGDWLYAELYQALLPISLQLATRGDAKGTQALRDATTLKQFIAGAALVTLMDAPWAVLFIALLFYIHLSLGLLVTAGAVLLMLCTWLGEAMVRKPMRKSSGMQVGFLQELDYATRNADVIEAMGMFATLRSRWQTGQQALIGLQAQAGGRVAVIQGIGKFLRLTLQILVTALAAYLAIGHQVSTGAIIAASILSSRALAPFEAVIGSWKMLNETRAAYARLKTIVAIPLRVETLSLPSPQGMLSVENVHYVVPQSNQVLLRNITFTVSPGEILGVVGPSGSGKSTLCKLLTGIWQASGGIVRLDGADVYTWPRTEFGRFTGYLPQDVELFSGSVKENIARLEVNPEPEAIVSAAQWANAHELILHLKDGYDTNIGPNGAMLSAGQRQRIGLARAFYGNPQLLILDEPDANLDDAGKQALVSALQHAKQQQMTVIVITHHKAILSHVDTLLMVNNGMIEAFGPTQQVLQQLQARQMPARGRA